MSLINYKKLKQIGRRFSVNEFDNKNHHQNSYIMLPSTNVIMSDLTKLNPEQKLELKNLLLNYNNGNGNDNDHHHQQLNYEQWFNTIRLLIRIPNGGIPQSFRHRLWLTIVENELQKKNNYNWEEIFERCFNNNYNNDLDDELSIQIIKDLHRTGCSLFTCERKENQLLLKQLLLAYARFNQNIGYCQGFNMIAAIIIEIMEGNIYHSLKIMIYLIEHILPEAYFTNNLRGLSVDMVVFRDLMNIKLPELSNHLNRLQQQSYDQTLGIYYEPPLINTFTMQWFLTLFANCLPKSTFIRIWDLLLVDGNEILLRTALIIWNSLSDRIMAVKTADEFYSIMNVLTRELIEFGPIDSNDLISAICNIETFPFPRLSEMRDNYYYNISPFNSSINQLKNSLVNMFNTSMQIFIDDDNDQSELQSQLQQIQSIPPSSSSSNNASDNWLDEQILLLNLYLNQNQSLNKSKTSPNRTPLHSITDTGSNLIDSIRKQIQSSSTSTSTTTNQIDISMLKKQYLKLKQRQQQVQIILKEGFQNKQLQSINEKNMKKFKKFSMSKLLIGKKPLLTTRNNKDDKNNNNDKIIPNRKIFNHSIYSGSNNLIFKRSKTFSSLTNDHNHHHQNNLNRKLINGKPTCKVIVQIQPSSSSSPTNNNDIVERQRSITPRLAKCSSGSSTSTELCDEILGISQINDDDDDLDYGDDDVINYDENDNDKDKLLTINNNNLSESSSPLSLYRQHRKPSSLSDIEEFINRQNSNNNNNNDEQDIFTIESNNDDDDDYFYFNNNNNDINDDDDDVNKNQLDETIKRFQEQIRQVNLENN